MVGKGPLANIHSTNDAAVGNDNFGYWCGSVGKSWVDRIEYANESRLFKFIQMYANFVSEWAYLSG